MKVLLIEDSSVHVQAALNQLSEHEITVFKSWKEFSNFGDFNGYPSAEKLLKFFQEYDMVLTDINIPGVLDNDCSEPEAPIGLVIVLSAIQSGVKYIGALTDANHHCDAISKTFCIWNAPEPFQVGFSKVKIVEGFVSRNEAESFIVIKELNGKREHVKNWLLLSNVLTA